VVVIAASNRPALIDSALLRPGRFDELIYVGVPELEGRRRILRIHTTRMPLGEDVDLDVMAERTQGCTGADLEDLVRRAGLHALRSDPAIGRVDMCFFDSALLETRASVTPEMEKEYRELADTLKRESPRGPKRIGFVAK
jgi:transitional endoplasmic reticulum ATPase